MTLLAEEIVEEWLNRNGFFTIRGIKLGVHEIDLLAIALRGNEIEARHIEVQVSINPVSYLCPLPKVIQKESGRKPMSMKMRSKQEMDDGVDEWISKKFLHDEKKRLRNLLYQGPWKFELVVNRVKFPEELEMIEKHGIKINRLSDIVKMLAKDITLIKSAAGSDLLELVMLGNEEYLKEWLCVRENKPDGL
jgi:hypothetical protein